MNNDGSPRKAIGLEGAQDGDVAAARCFVDWVHRELYGLGCVSSLPQSVRDRLLGLAREVDHATSFLDGFIAASDHKATK